MKRKIILFFVLILCLSITVFVSACSADESTALQSNASSGSSVETTQTSKNEESTSSVCDSASISKSESSSESESSSVSVSEKICTVTFNSKGGSAVEEQKVIKNDKVVKVDDPIKDGYRFDGWFADEKCGNDDKWSFVGYVVTSDMTLFAKWTAVSHSLDLDANFETGQYYSRYDFNTVKTDEKFTLTNTFTRKGYNFSGWATTADGNVVYSDGQEITMGTNDLTLFAKWTAKTDTAYSITYYLQNLNDSQYTINNALTENLQGTTDQQVSVETPKTIANYTYVAENSTPSGTIDCNGETVLKLYYNRKVFSVDFNLNGGTLDLGVQSQIVKYQGSAIAPTVSKIGYSLSWDKSFTNISENITVNAVWSHQPNSGLVRFDGGVATGTGGTFGAFTVIRAKTTTTSGKYYKGEPEKITFTVGTYQLNTNGSYSDKTIRFTISGAGKLYVYANTATSGVPQSDLILCKENGTTVSTVETKYVPNGDVALLTFDVSSAGNYAIYSGTLGSINVWAMNYILN